MWEYGQSGLKQITLSEALSLSRNKVERSHIFIIYLKVKKEDDATIDSRRKT